MARIRERGFDHSALIAKEFARLRGLPYQPLLTRNGRTKQAGATKIQRVQQIQGVYLPRPRASIKDRHILVIDDVTTTGATLIEVANVLRAAGAKNLDALVFAQTIQ
jgi:predicted amidophosphoribosyltransferase